MSRNLRAGPRTLAAAVAIVLSGGGGAWTVPVLADPAVTETQLKSTPNPSALGETVRLEAIVTSFGGGVPAGTVSFAHDGDELGDGTVETVGIGSPVATGGYHTCALTATGGVKCWGRNIEGQLGDGSTTDRHTPVDVDGLGSGVAAIATGDLHTCALTAMGGVRCWGWNFYGQLGDGSTTPRHTPVDVDGLGSGVVAIDAGYYHTCALTAAGGVQCWGRNWFGQLGDGMTSGNDPNPSPVDVSGLGSGVAAIAAGGQHSCALTAAGGVKCWGWNGNGQIGDGSTSQRNTPVDVSGLGSGVATIATGGEHTCALTAVGGARCWGNNGHGPIGDGSTTQRLTPVAVTGLGDGSTLQFGRAVLETAALPGGLRGLTAAYSGDDDHEASASAVLEQAVLPAATSTALDATANPSVFGQAVTLTATVTSGAGTPGGAVIFREGATVVGSAPLNGSGVATQPFEGGDLPVGAYSFTAEYVGSASHTGSISSSLAQTVNKGATATAVSTGPNPSLSGQTVTITATVSPVAPAAGVPTGTLSFFAGASLLGTAPLSGGTASLQTASLAVGGHSVTAEYGGDARFDTSISSAAGHAVGKGSTTTAVSSGPNPSQPGQTVTITATVSPVAPAAGVPAGTVTFRDGAAVLGTANLNGAGVATFQTSALAVGARSITAEYGGNAAFNASTSPAAGHVVNPFASTTVVAGPGATALGEGATFTATVSSAGGVPAGSVTFRDGAVVIGTAALSGGTASLTTAALPMGNRSITAEYGGSATIAGSTSSAIAHAVGKAVASASLAATPKTGKPGRAVRLTARMSAAVAANGTPGGQVTFRLGTRVLGTAPLSGGTASLQTTALPIGDNQVSATYAGNAVFAGATASLEVTVDPRLGPEVRVNTHTAGHQRGVSLARLSTGGYVAVWESQGQDGSGFGVFGQRFGANGQRQGAEFAVNRTTAKAQQGARAAALKGGAFVVVWESQGQDGSGFAVIAQRFSKAGRPAGPEIVVNSHTAGHQRRPAVAGLDDGGFVVAWESAGQDGSGLGVYAQRFDQAGRRQGGETQVNVSTAGDQRQPAVAGLSDGGFAVVWASRHEAAFGLDVYARRFTKAGRAQGGEILINRTRAADQGEPAIAALGTGAVVVWTSAGQDGSGRGVFGQRLNQRGAGVGGEFAVNTTTQRDQFQPSVAVVGRGFLAAWTSARQDGSGRGVYAQGFAANGGRIDAEFRVNTTTERDQSGPAVAPLAQGRFVAAWTSAIQDGSGNGVFAQRFDIPQLGETRAGESLVRAQGDDSGDAE